MSVKNYRKYSDFKGINLRAKNGVLRFEDTDTAPTTTSGEYLLYVDGGVLYYDDGSATYDLTTGAGGGISSWDGLYDSDKTLTIDDTTLTFNLTHATGDGLTLSSGVVAGALLQFANSGTGPDIQGTSDLWSISAAGLVTCVGITTTSDVTSTGAAIDWDLVDNNASALSFDATGKAGIIAIVTTNDSEGVTMSGTLTVAGALTASTGVSSSDGTCTFTDNSNAANGLVFVNDTVTTYGNATDAGPVHFSSASLTTGHLLTLSLDESELAGGSFLRCWQQDGGAAVFNIGENGATTIAGNAAGTDAFVITAGDILLNDSDQNIIESEDGTTTTLLIDNKAGVIGSDAAVLTLDAGGAVASGGNILRLAATGSPNAGAIALEIANNTKDLTAMYIDCDSATNHEIYVTNGGNLGAGKSMLYLDYDGTGNATSTLLTLDATGATMTNTPYAMSILTTGKDGAALNIDSDAATDSSVLINGGGAIADNKAVVEITADGTPANTGANVLRVAFTGTATNKPTLVELIGAGKDCEALNIDADPTTKDVVYVHTDAVIADNKAVMSLHSAGAMAAGSSILRLAQAGTPAGATSYTLEIDNTGSTTTNNAVTMRVNHHTSTAAIAQFTSAGAAAVSHIDLECTNAGATGSILSLSHQGGSQAANDYTGQILFIGEDDAAADNTYAAIYSQVNASAAGSEDGRLELHVSVGGTLTEVFAVESTAAGAKDCEIKTATCTLDGSADGTTAFTITAGDLSLSAGGIDTTTTADQYGLSVTVNKTAATQAVAQIVNAHTTSAKPVLQLSQADLDQPYIDFTGATQITSASAGANGDVPAQVREYILVETDAGNGKIPVYAV